MLSVIACIRISERMQGMDNIVFHSMIDQDIIRDFRSLPMGKYEDILKVMKDDSLEEIDRQVEVISILTDTDKDTILSLPITDYKELVVASRFLAVAPEVSSKVAKEYIIGDYRLVPTDDIRKIITAQYKDFQEYVKDIENNVVEILSCFLIPKGKKYLEDYDVLDVQTAIREELSVSDAMNLCAFFMMRLGDLMVSSLTSLKKESKKKPELMERVRKIEKMLEGVEILS